MAEDVERILRSKIRGVVIAAIGEDRPFMDVPDVAERITMGIVDLLKQGTADNEAVVSIHGGNAYVDKMPVGVIVKIRDYDIDGCEEDELRGGDGGQKLYRETVFKQNDTSYYVLNEDDGDPC